MGLFSRKSEDGDTPKQTTEAEVVTQTAAPAQKQAIVGSQVHGVLVAPVITEKSHAQTAAATKYTFRVARTATKSSIRKAVEEIYKVHVQNVHVITVPRKRRTIKYDRGFQKSYKKAIVTLKKGDHIAAFDLA